MKLAIFTDIHCFAPNELMTFDAMMYLAMNLKTKNGYTTVDLGDNFDLANCKNSELKECEKKYYAYYDNRSFFDHTVNGNHERYESVHEENLRRIILQSGVMLTHGDFEFWGASKALKYRRKPRGASFLKRGVVVKGIEWLEKNFESKIDNEFLERAYQKCHEFGCHTYICGHKHPDETVTIEYKGCKIIVLKRGVNCLEV